MPGSRPPRRAAMPFLLSSRRVGHARIAPDEWRARALRECDAAEILFARSLPAWLSRSTPTPFDVRRRARPSRLLATRSARLPAGFGRSFLHWRARCRRRRAARIAASSRPLVRHTDPRPSAEAGLALDEAHDQLAARVDDDRRRRLARGRRANRERATHGRRLSPAIRADVAALS